MLDTLRNLTEYNQKWPDVDIDALICWQSNKTGAGDGDSGFLAIRYLLK